MQEGQRVPLGTLQDAGNAAISSHAWVVKKILGNQCGVTGIN